MLENSANSSTREGHTQQKWPQARRQRHGAMWRSLLLTGVLMVAALVAAAIPAHAQEADLSINGADQVGASLAGVTAPERVGATTITVDTSEDLTPDSLTKTCGFNAGIFNAAKLKEVQQREVLCTLGVADAEEYWSMMTEVAAPFLAALSSADADTVARVKADVIADMSARYPKGKIDASAFVVTGKK